MFNRDTWSEIWIALKQNKLRTALTGFAISWGIFMLVLLSSVGVGFKNSVMEKFESENKNSFKIWAGETSIPYKGNAANRFIHFTDKDWDIIRNNPTSNDKITYPTMSIVGINPLLTVQSDIKDGNSYLTDTIVNGKLCNENDKDSKEPYKNINGEAENINEECRRGGVFQKVPLLDRIVQKFGGTNEDYENRK